MSFSNSHSQIVIKPYVKIERDPQKALELPNNDYCFCRNVDMIQRKNPAGWLKAREGQSKTSFLRFLATLVHPTQFTGEGVAKMIKRLIVTEKKDVIEIAPDGLSIRVTQKWLKAHEEHGQPHEAQAPNPKGAQNNARGAQTYTGKTAKLDAVLPYAAVAGISKKDSVKDPAEAPSIKEPAQAATIKHLEALTDGAFHEALQAQLAAYDTARSEAASFAAFAAIAFELRLYLREAQTRGNRILSQQELDSLSRLRQMIESPQKLKETFVLAQNQQAPGGRRQAAAEVPPSVKDIAAQPTTHNATEDVLAEIQRLFESEIKTPDTRLSFEEFALIARTWWALVQKHQHNLSQAVSKRQMAHILHYGDMVMQSDLTSLHHHFTNHQHKRAEPS